MNTKLTTRQICFIFIAFFSMYKMIILPSVTARYSDESLWISSLINFIPDILMVFFMLKMNDAFGGKTFYEIIEINCGRVFAKCVYAIYFIFFILKAYVPIFEQKYFVEITLYETMPTLLTFLPFFLVSFFISFKGLKGLGRSADALIYIASFGYVVLIALSIPSTDLTELLPVFGVKPQNILTGSYRTFLWYFDSAYMLFFIGHFKSEKLQKTKILISYVICALVVLAFMIILYGEFGAITNRQYFAPLKMGKFNVALSNIGRIDYIAGFIFALVNIFSLSIPLVTATMCLEKLIDFKRQFMPALIVNSFMTLAIIFTEGYFLVLVEIFQRYISLYFIFCSLVIPLIMLLFRKGRVKNEIL